MAWSYEDVFDEARIIKNYIALDWQSVDEWFCDDSALLSQQRPTAIGEENPFVSWLVHEAWKTTNIPDLLAESARVLCSFGLPLLRMHLFVRTLNPQLYGLFFRWERNADEVDASQATHSGVQSEAYLSSPYAPIINGEGGVRRTLEGDAPLLEV